MTRRRRVAYVRTPRLRGRVGPVRASVGLTGASVSVCCLGCSPCLVLVGLVVTAAVMLSVSAGTVPGMTPDIQHDHSGFEMPPGFVDPFGRTGIDYDLIARTLAVAYDGCTTCQAPLLSRLADDAASTARLVELACIMVDDALGSVPRSMTDDSVPGQASPEFRRLAMAGVDGRNDAMSAECGAMTPEQRRAALDAAIDMIVGYMHL